MKRYAILVLSSFIVLCCYIACNVSASKQQAEASDSDSSSTPPSAASTGVPPPAPVPASDPKPVSSGSEEDVGPLLLEWNFAEGLHGWGPRQDDKENKAIGRVELTTERGARAMKLLVNLIANDKARSKGEAFKRLRGPRDLTGRTVRAQVICDAQVSGSATSPSGIQVFVKDAGDASRYSAWHNLVPNTPLVVRMLVTASPPDTSLGEHLDADFQPRRIIEVGVKVGSNRGANGKAEGSCVVGHVGVR
jgi:hypothetical protein